MDTQTANAIKKGITYVRENGRAVERALAAYRYEDGRLEAVIAEIKAYQNPDGGFGHAYEPDLRCPDSSALCTTEALQTCWKLGLTADHPMVKAAVTYLLETYQPEAKSWHFIPPASQKYPRAPWWGQFDPDAGASKHNPRPEILGILWRASSYVPQALLEELTEAVLADFEADIDNLQMHDLYCYLRLVRTPDLRADIHDRLMKHLPTLIQKNVDTDEAAWAGYGVRPYAVVQSKQDVFYPLVADAMPRALAYLLNEQLEDGSWPLTWNWGENFPEAWPQAQYDWKSRITLENVELLGRFR